MPHLRLLSIPLALLFAAGSANAQYRGTSTPSAGANHASVPAAHQASGGSWNGTASKWGGSPVQTHVRSRERLVYAVPNYAYIPDAVAAPAPVAVTYADTVYVPTSAPAEMKVVHAAPEPRQLTTIEVYRLQPRFQKP